MNGTNECYQIKTQTNQQAIEIYPSGTAER